MKVDVHMILYRVFFTALWPHRNQSFILVQDVQKTLPTKAITCRQMEPISSEWPVALIAKSDQQSPSPHHDNFNDELQQSALSTTSHSRWKQDALQA